MLVVIIAVLLWHDRTLAVPAPLGPVDDQPSGTPDDDGNVQVLLVYLMFHISRMTVIEE